MNEKLSENLSAFMDGESKDSSVVEALSKDDEARATWARYQLISDVLNNRYSKDIEKIAERVNAALADEATIVTPKQWLNSKHLMKQVAGLAVAATVAAVAIIIVRDVPQTVTSVEQVAIAPITHQPIRLTAAVEKKLNGYLVSHNEFSASTRMKGMLPYSRIVSQAPGQLVSQDTGPNAE